MMYLIFRSNLLIHNIHRMRIQSLQILRLRPQLIFGIFFLPNGIHILQEYPIKPINFHPSISSGHIKLIFSIDKIRLIWLLYTDSWLHFF